MPSLEHPHIRGGHPKNTHSSGGNSSLAAFGAYGPTYPLRHLPRVLGHLPHVLGHLHHVLGHLLQVLRASTPGFGVRRAQGSTPPPPSPPPRHKGGCVRTRRKSGTRLYRNSPNYFAGAPAARRPGRTKFTQQCGCQSQHAAARCSPQRAFLSPNSFFFFFPSSSWDGFSMEGAGDGPTLGTVSPSVPERARGDALWVWSEGGMPGGGW